MPAALDERDERRSAAHEQRADALRARRTCDPRSRRGRAPAVATRRSSHCGACTASVCSTARGARPRTSAAISASGCTTPVSLLTSITETTAVFGSSAAARASRSTTPVSGRADAASRGSPRAPGARPRPAPPCARSPWSRRRRAHRSAPARGPRRALDREVVALAPAAREHDLERRRAERARDRFARFFECASSPARDAACDPDGLPGCSARNGSIASIASGRIGVDAAWSRYTAMPKS